MPYFPYTVAIDFYICIDLVYNTHPRYSAFGVTTTTAELG